MIWQWFRIPKVVIHNIHDTDEYVRYVNVKRSNPSPGPCVTPLYHDVVAGPVAGDVCGLLEAGVGAAELHHRYAYEAGGAGQGRNHTTVQLIE